MAAAAAAGGCVRDVITKAPLVSRGKREIEARYFNIFPPSVELSFCAIRKEDATEERERISDATAQPLRNAQSQEYILASD